MQIRVKLFVLNENAAKRNIYIHIWIPDGLYATEDSSVEISDPSKRDAKGKTDDRKGI